MEFKDIQAGVPFKFKLNPDHTWMHSPRRLKVDADGFAIGVSHDGVKYDTPSDVYWTGIWSEGSDGKGAYVHAEETGGVWSIELKPINGEIQ